MTSTPIGSPVSITIQGIDALLKLTNIDVKQHIRAALYAIGELIKTELVRAPGPVKKPINWASDKQRRAYFAKRRLSGPFQKGHSKDMFMGPWVRESDPQSERLIASWTVRHEGDDVVVGNHTSYGPWVQGWFDQQLMHKQTGWVTDDEAVNIVSRSGDIERVLGQALEHALRSG